ncbi:MAG: adenylate/guanylate cyclase domain-containing protein [Rhodospirillales bacterium]
MLYCRASEGDWAHQGEWAETDEFEALTAAHDADDQSKWQAVRLMNRRTYPDGRPPQETIAWMTGIPRAGKAKPRNGGGGNGGNGSGSGDKGGGGGDNTSKGAGNQPIAGQGSPDKKRRKKRKGGAESAGEAYKKIAKQHLEATGAIGGSHSVKRAAEEAALREAEAGKPRKAPLIAVGTRLVTVFIITAVITFAGKIPLDILHRKLVASGIDIPGFMIAGYVLGFAIAALFLAKILLKEGDMDILIQYFQDARSSGQDDDDEFDAYDSGLGNWREDALGDDPMGDLEEEAVTASAPAPTASGLDYPPDNVPAEPRKSMLKFLELALGSIRSQLAKLDKLGKFGLNLYLAGAGDQLAKHSGLEGAQRNGMITEAIVAIGTKKAMAGPFCDKFAEYEKDSKSRAMIDAGRTAMQRFMDGDDKAFGDLPSILESFTSNKAAKATAQGVVVVMFTDLVGSTKMTQELGDMGAQQVVRTHNAIVRNALAAYHGREVKHTGDGIMAVFSNAANAVASTMVMQQELAKHNGAQGSLPVKVRIGLNAGAAVQEEDDFFGTTVQLSARVCDKADAEQIFITQSVRDLVTGHSIQFREAGNFDMKGIEKPVPVYEVVWRAELQAVG